jgi:hypothetical protein
MARVMGGMAGLALAVSGCGLVGGEDEAATASGLDLSAPSTAPATSTPEAVAFAAAGNVICDEELVAVRLGPLPTDPDLAEAFLLANAGALDRITARLRQLPPPPGDEAPVTEAIDALAGRRAAIDEVLVALRTDEGAGLVALAEEQAPDIAATKDAVDAVGLDRCWQEPR